MSRKGFELDKAYEPAKIEDRVYKKWKDSGVFKPSDKGKPFCIVIPPPNITGSLHMGHALNATIQDILVRKKRMEGRKTLWLPGTDHAGIAAQNVVEKNLLKTENKRRHDLGREKFIEKVWEWKEKYGSEILRQLEKIGASCDWSRTRFTMDDDYQKKVKEAFINYYKKDRLYRAERVVNWCTRCQTSLSDLELEHKEEKGKLYWIKYGPFILATTRPETKLGDTAVAVNPKDKRYKDMVGKEYEIPGVLGKFTIKVVADKSVDSNFGSGAVKVTPAHSIIDSEVAERHGLPMKKIIDECGRMMDNCGKYAGLKTGEARERIVEDMQKIGLIEKIEDYTHNVATCYRCGSIVENLPSMQWFLKMGELAKSALKAVKDQKVKFHPQKWEKIYKSWSENTKDWCVSRQIWWGHRLPVFYCNKKQEEISNSNEQKFIVAEEKPKKCLFCGECEMVQSEDVLDTWFSSALWPFATMKPADLKTFYPTDILSTARDIINLWVARMVFSGIEFTKKTPFKDVIIHPTILTKEGKRMSKSLGTGIDPMNYVNQYGADATRFGLIWQMMTNQDIHWAEEHIVAGKKFLNKIWNAARFILFQTQGLKKTEVVKKPKAITVADKKILQKLTAVVSYTDKGIETYKFGQALRELYDFFWHDFCDKYLEASKKQIQDKKLNINTQIILLKVLSDSLKLLHPFIPHITEEIWSKIPYQKRTLIKTDWPKK